MTTFSHEDVDVRDLTAGAWTKMAMGSYERIYLCCPVCEVIAPLESHTVEDDGTITPSLNCAQCEFHAQSTLEDFNDA